MGGDWGAVIFHNAFGIGVYFCVKHWTRKSRNYGENNEVRSMKDGGWVFCLPIALVSKRVEVIYFS